MSVGIVISNEIMGSTIFVAAAHATRKTKNLVKEAENADSTTANTNREKEKERNPQCIHVCDEPTRW